MNLRLIGYQEQALQGLVASKEFRERSARYRGRLSHRIAVNPTADGGKRDRLEVVLAREFQGGEVAAREQFRLAGSAATPHRADRVDYVTGGKSETWSDSAPSSGATNAGPNLGQSATRLEKLWASRAMDGAVHAASAEHPLVGSIDDGVDVKPGNVTLDDANAMHVLERRLTHRALSCTAS